MSKERLVELIEQCAIDNDMPSSEQLADCLLANGVIVPHFKIGGKAYQTDGTRIYESTILEIICTSKRTVYITQGISFDETAIGTSIFLTREEAEAKLKESESE